MCRLIPPLVASVRFSLDSFCLVIITMAASNKKFLPNLLVLMVRCCSFHRLLFSSRRLMGPVIIRQVLMERRLLVLIFHTPLSSLQFSRPNRPPSRCFVVIPLLLLAGVFYMRLQRWRLHPVFLPQLFT